MDDRYLNFHTGWFGDKNFRLMHDMMRREFVYSVIHDDITSAFDVEKYRKVLDMVHFPTVAMVVQVDGKTGEKPDKDLFKKRRKIAFAKLCRHLDDANDGLIAILGRNSINAVVAGDREIVILLPVVEEEAERQIVLSRRYAGYIKVIMERHAGFTLSIGIGSNYTDVKSLSRSYKEACQALKYKFYKGNSAIIHYMDIDARCEGNIRFFVERETRLVEDIRKNDFDGVIGTVKSLFSFAERKNRIMPETFKVRILEMLTVISRTAIDLGVDPGLMLSLKVRVGNEIEERITAEEMQKWLLDIIQVILDAIDRIQQDSAVKMVNRAKVYIEKNYFRDISLEEAARYVNISPFYLSHIFREVTGSSFTNYLTGVRIEKAQNMLRSGDMPVYEISGRVGYQDPNYFSRIFKRVVGQSPLQFRKGNKA